jgi:hypothetical protein
MGGPDLIAGRWAPSGLAAQLPLPKFPQHDSSSVRRLLEVDQELGQPLGVGSLVKPSDQRGAVGVRSSEHVEELARTSLTDGGDDKGGDVSVIHGRAA